MAPIDLALRPLAATAAAGRPRRRYRQGEIVALIRAVAFLLYAVALLAREGQRLAGRLRRRRATEAPGRPTRRRGRRRKEDFDGHDDALPAGRVEGA